MKNWALANRLDWFAGRGKGGLGGDSGSLQSRRERGSPPKAQGQDQEWKLCPAYMPGPGRWRGRRKVEREAAGVTDHKGLGDRPV